MAIKETKKGAGPGARGGEKKRLDALLVERGLAETRTRAQALIMAGSVLVDGEVSDKAGRAVSDASEVTLKERLPFVSRGGVKLAGALDAFAFDVEGLVVMDVGSSTGGFTDCLLKRGAARVHAVDVGRGLIDQSLREDPRVRLLEGRNIRHLSFDEVGEKVALIVIDVSFISLEIVLPGVTAFLGEGGAILALVKPQFEVGRGEVGKGGIVRDPGKQRAAVEKVVARAASLGLRHLGTTESPIKGAKGNREFWVRLSP